MVKSRENIIGRKFGRLLVLEQIEDEISPCGHKNAMYRCLCDCERECEKRRSELRPNSQCPICAQKTINEKLTKTHEQYLLELSKLNIEIQPIEPYQTSKKKIKHKCNICGHGSHGEWLVRPSALLEHPGCPICAGKWVGSPPEYKNSIWASAYREYFSQFLTEEQMKSVTPGSSTKKLDAICPTCKRHKLITATNLKQGIRCICEDGFSYPEKFFYAFLQQIGVEFEYHKTFEWSKRGGHTSRTYDFYIPSIHAIVELNGNQHYRGFGSFQQLEDIQNNDAFKKELALQNGIDHYIVIDCSRSEQVFIANNITSSILLSLLDVNMSTINWEQCAAFAIKSFVQVAADYWNDGLIISDIATRLQVCKGSVCAYLRQATEAGLCSYTPEESNERRSKQLSGKNHVNSKPIYCIELDMVFYDGANYVAKQTNIAFSSNMTYSCNHPLKRGTGEHPITKEKLHWLYLDYAIQNGYISRDDAEMQKDIDNIKILNEMILNNTK